MKSAIDKRNNQLISSVHVARSGADGGGGRCKDKEVLKMSWLDGTNGKLAAIRIEIIRSKFWPGSWSFRVVFLGITFTCAVS